MARDAGRLGIARILGAVGSKVLGVVSVPTLAPVSLLGSSRSPSRKDQFAAPNIYRCCTSAVEADQSDPRLWLFYGFVLDAAGRKEEALSIMDKAYAIPNDVSQK